MQLDPLYVTFNPSERDLGVIQTARNAGQVVAKVSLPDDPSAGYSGELTFIDNGVDRTTGTITARATVPNPKFTLLPGQYVRVRLHVRDEADAMLVPQTALGSSQLGKYVFVVGADGKAEQKIVSLGTDRRRRRQRDRPRRDRSGDHRQSAEDRSGIAGRTDPAKKINRARPYLSALPEPFTARSGK